jgi:hypothetical protein
MAWAVRGKRRYYYRSIRVGGRMTTRYLGSGLAADAEASAVEHRHAERAARAQAAQAEQQRYTAAAAPLDGLCRLTDLLLKAALLGEGYHQHDRGAWRRRRHAPTP